MVLTHFMPLISFDTPRKYENTSGFLIFSGGIKEISGMKWVIRRYQHCFVIFIVDFDRAFIGMKAGCSPKTVK